MLRPRFLPYIALIIGIAALGLSAIFIRWAEAPGPITSFYRLAFAGLMITPFVFRQRSFKTGIKIKHLFIPGLAGVFTAFDLAVWSSALDYTTAANATLLGNIAPLWVAIVSWLIFYRKLRGNFWIGLMLTLVGAALVLGHDLTHNPRLGYGDLLALFSSIFFAGYYLTTERSRERFDPLSFMWIVCITASLVLFMINIFLGHSFWDYSIQTWTIFLATALVIQIVGYTAVAYALGHLPAAVVSPTMIGQPVMTALIAIPLLGEIPLTVQLIGGIVVLVGVYLVHRSYLTANTLETT